jgi:alkylhydroperoxidase/carboxymuconolactone decarboxylase family protein YurZ
MKDLHAIFTRFKEDFPEVHRAEAALGEEIHLRSGPIPEKYRWLIKVAISGGMRLSRALETHIQKAREAGASEEEIRQVLLLLVPTCGFPVCMEAYEVYKGMK